MEIEIEIESYMDGERELERDIDGAASKLIITNHTCQRPGWPTAAIARVPMRQLALAGLPTTRTFTLIPIIGTLIPISASPYSD